MNDFNDDKLKSKIEEGLNSLDESINVNVPDIERFRKMINQAEYNKEKKKRRDLLIFILVAAMVIIIETFAFSRSIMFFAIIQCLGSSIFSICLVSWAIKSNKKVKPL